MAVNSPTQSNIQAALVSFLGVALPGVTVVSGQNNRTAEPGVTNFVVMTPIAFDRIATNFDTPGDVRFTALIAGTTMTVTNVFFGTLAVGATVFGTGVAPGTTITAFGTAVGGVGTYIVSLSQNVVTTTMSAGNQQLMQEAIATIQLDFHSADTTGGDMAETFTTTFRDEFAVDFFAGLAAPLNTLVPLYTEEPKQIPFINDQQQYEWRWIVEAKLQANQIVPVPQQFADVTSVQIVSVDGGGVVPGGFPTAGTPVVNALFGYDGVSVLTWPDGTMVVA